MIKMKTVLIFFSESGNTKVVAKTLSENLNTDLIEVRDLKNRNGFVGKVLSSIDISSSCCAFLFFIMLYLTSNPTTNNTISVNIIFMSVIFGFPFRLM